MEKLGVFLCTGCDIGNALDVAALEEAANENGASTCVTHECLCAPEGLAEIQKNVDDGSVDGVIIAACSARAKTREFTFDPMKVVVERVSLREQVAWSHEHGHEDTQALASDLLLMGLARAGKISLPKPLDEPVERSVLVVGAGLAGLTAAQAAAAMGNPVVLVEKESQLCGYLGTVKDLVPELPPYDKPHDNKIKDLANELEATSDVRVLKSTKIAKISGQPGQFEVELQTASGSETVKVGAIVQATGAQPYDASRLESLGYGKSPNVVTSRDLEKMLLEGKLLQPSSGQVPRRVVFVQCAGSRDQDHLPYCSSECCATTLKQIAAVRRDSPDVECAVVYRDIRAPGQLEHFYRAVQEQSGNLFTRGVVKEVSVEGERLSVQVTESLLGDDLRLDADLVVLAVGMVPNSADGEAIRAYVDAKKRSETADSETQRQQAAEQAEQLKRHEGTEILNLTYRQGPDLPVLRYEFPDSHFICFPYETRRTGIYAAGAVRAPMDAAQAAEDGMGAAMKAVQCIAATARGESVHPRSGDLGVADFFLQRCTQCKRCTEECPFGTLDEDVKGTPQYNQLRCRRCGICMGACPERIVSFPDYSVDAVASMIKAFEVPDEFEEKPRVVALVCENDALPALDEAAARKMQWDPWVRIVPVRCLGSVNTVWIADALSRGIDGILLMGCKHGDDYQCHYVRGSELCSKRMENVQETLNRLTLEPERVRIEQVARNEFERAPQILQEFAETMEQVGANPYKGF